MDWLEELEKAVLARSRVGTHWDKCHLRPDHADCAIARLLELVRNLQMELSGAIDVTKSYMKGCDDGVVGVAMRWKEALTQPIPKPGVMNEPLEGLYRSTEQLRAECELWKQRCNDGWTHPDSVMTDLNRYRAALELIAAPKRADGTYNRSREACEILARKALDA